MAKTELRLDARRALKDGTYPVQLKVGYGTNLYLSTGIYLKLSEWDPARRLCKGKGARLKNKILAKRLLRTNLRVLELMDNEQFSILSRAQLKQMLTDFSLKTPTIGLPNVGEYFDKVISLKAGKTRISYEQTRKQLEKYCGDLHRLRFETVDYQFFEGWRQKMSGYKRNTIVRRMKDLKAVLRYACENGIEVNGAYRRVDTRAEKDTPLRTLPVEIIRKLMNLELEGNDKIYRDAFVLSFFLIGINPADMKKLTRSSVVNGRIQYKRSKTGKNYSIKIEPEAQDIINRYPGNAHLLDFGERFRCFDQNCNNFLGKFQKGVTLYWARYSWANYAVDLDIPKDTISEALGHKHGADITGVYIKYSTDKIDAANRAVIDYVLK